MSHLCPDCGTVVPGSGNSKCRPCTNRLQLYREVELTTLILTGDWAKTLYRQFAEWLYNRQSDSPNLMKVLRAHQTFFERIDTEFFHVAQVSPAALLQTFGTAGLRKHLLVTRFLAICLSLVITPEDKAENADLDRIRTKLIENKKQPWGEILSGYAASLLSAEVSIRTRRMYVATAEAFCQFAKPSNAPWPEDMTRQFLHKKPGLRANLSKFVGYCRRAYNWEVTMPPHGHDRVKLSASPRTVPHLQKLLQEVAKEGLDKVSHVTLARIIAKSLGFPIKTFLGVSSLPLRRDLNRIILDVEGEPVVIPPELEDIVRAFIARIDLEQVL